MSANKHHSYPFLLRHPKKIDFFRSRLIHKQISFTNKLLSKSVKLSTAFHLLSELIISHQDPGKDVSLSHKKSLETRADPVTWYREEEEGYTPLGYHFKKWYTHHTFYLLFGGYSSVEGLSWLGFTLTLRRISLGISPSWFSRDTSMNLTSPRRHVYTGRSWSMLPDPRGERPFPAFAPTESRAKELAGVGEEEQRAYVVKWNIV